MRKIQSWMLIFVMIACFVSNANALGNDLSDSVRTPVWNEIQRMQNDFRSGQAEKMAHWIAYPLELEYPMKAIKDSAEFVSRVDEVFDTYLIDKISNLQKKDLKTLHDCNSELCMILDELISVSGQSIHAIYYSTKRLQMLRKAKIDSMQSATWKDLIRMRGDFRSGEPSRMARWFLYPMQMDAPMKVIEDTAEFVARIDEVVDADFRTMMANFSQEDWDFSEQYLTGNCKYKNGLISFSNGLFGEIDYSTARFRKLKKNAIDSVKNLFGSFLPDFENPVLEYWTPIYHVFIDIVSDGYRYAAWPRNAKLNTAPELVVRNGYLTRLSGANHGLLFVSGNMEISVTLRDRDDCPIRAQEGRAWGGKGETNFPGCPTPKKCSIDCDYEESSEGMPSKEILENISKIIRSGDARQIANLFDYPIELVTPVPSIKDTAEMRVRFAEVVDNYIVNNLKCATQENWLESGSGAIHTGGKIIVNRVGKIDAILHVTEACRKHQSDILREIGSNLHSSVAQLDEEINQFCTKSHRIRIDRVAGKLRYVSWERQQSTLMQPALVIQGGEREWIQNEKEWIELYNFHNQGFLYTISLGDRWTIQVKDEKRNKLFPKQIVRKCPEN